MLAHPALAHPAFPTRSGEASPTLVAVAHGSRDPRALDTVRALLRLVRGLRPDVPVRLGHIELNEPLLSRTLAALPPGRAVLVPLLLGRGHHVSYDIPAAAAAAPHLDIRLAEPLGPHPLLAEVLHERLLEAGQRIPGPRIPGPGTHAVVLAAAGSRDPDAAVDTRTTAALLAARLGVPVAPAFASAPSPGVPEALRMLAARGRNAAVAAYFTAPGRFAAQCAAAAEAASGWASAPLGAHPAMARLVLHRYDQAMATGTTAATRRLHHGLASA
ncbi:hypothetical protein Sm713_33680 [Streptomyces sp. TS71-3]|nr:sirohydrochlorin chelatase [Streptomyces sp. TS71-3]GHJ37759.1 hypothetical protein Sm713_33680 [Streptomyces sp. TS71-3]